jgi:hypothetical protein
MTGGGCGGESGEEDLGFGFDDEEGVGIGMAVGAELLEGVVKGGGQDGEDYGAIVAADEVEAALLLDELELRGHLRKSTALANGRSDSHCWVREIPRCARNDST